MLNRIFYNQIDCDYLPRAEREQYQEIALRRLLVNCADHPLLDGRVTGDVALANIRPSESKDHGAAIRQEGIFANRPARDPNARIVFSTSGSSGRQRLLLTSYQEIINNARLHGKGYVACGITPQHKVASFGEVGRFASEFAVIAALDMSGCTIVPIVNHLDVIANASLFRDLKTNVLLAMQSELLAYLDYWESTPETALSLQLVVTGGEPMSSPVRRRLTQLFGPELAIRGTFQTADAGTIGYQCPNCAENEFHLHEELQLVEILDTTGGHADNEGDLVVTNLYRYEMPVIRMKTGDRAAWSNVPERCNCGRTARRLKLLGRTPRQLKIGGEKVSGAALEALGMQMAPNGEIVQFVIHRAPGGGDAITAHAKSFAAPELASIARSLLHADALLGRLIGQGRLAALEVSGDLPTDITATMHKPRTIVDVRDTAFASHERTAT